MEWISSPKALSSFLIVLAGIVCWIIMKKIIVRFWKDRKSSNYKFFLSLIKSAIFIVCIFAVLETNGVDVTALMAGFGIASVIVAFSLQDTLKDVIMGFHILHDDYFDQGDVVIYDGVEGVVESFTTRTTKIRSIVNEDLYVVSNRDIEKIIKTSGLCDVDIPLPSDEDPDDMHELMRRIASRVAEMEDVEKAEYKGTQSFNDSSISYKLRFYCNPAIKPQVRRNVLMAIQDELKKADVCMPYNQLDIHRIDK